MFNRLNIVPRVAAALARSVGAAILTLMILLAVWHATRPVPAAAQPPCGAHAEIVKQLGDRFAEHPIATGLSSEGAVMQVFASKDGLTWSLVATRPDGTSCLVASGESLQLLKITVRGSDA